MVIVSLTFKVPTEVVDQHLKAHSEFLKSQYEQGNFSSQVEKCQALVK